MPSIALNLPHALSVDEATQRLQKLLNKLKEQHQDKISDLEEEWNGNQLTYSFSTYGFKVSGDVSVEPGEVKLNGSLPFAAMMFKGKIEQAVQHEMEKLLA